MTRRLVTMLFVGLAALLMGIGTAAANPAPRPGERMAPHTTAGTLPFSWQGQQRYYYCGPAATRMALSTRMDSPPSQDAIADHMGTNENGTDNVGLVRDALNDYLGTSWFDAKYINDTPTQDQRDLLARDVTYDLDRGYPLVANVVSGWRPPGYPGGWIYHYVAVVGYGDSGNSVLIADPAGEGAGGSGWEDVPGSYWISTYDLGTWIGGRGYAA